MPSTPSLPPAGAAMAKYWIDGQLVDQADAVVPVGDLGFSRGYAAFDALRTYGPVPFLLDAHLARFERTCELLGLKLPVTRSELAEIIAKTLEANSFPDSSIRMYLTAGPAAGMVPEGRERLMVLVDPVRPFPARQLTEGVALARSVLARTFPLAKSTTYLAGVWETVQARSRGYDEVVFCDAQGDILEGTTFSIGAIRGQEIFSARDDILEAITMEHLLGLAAGAGFKITRAPLSRAILAQADEVFISSSFREIIPVSRIDDARVRDGMPAPVTRQLHELYLRSVHAHCGILSAGAKMS